VFHLAILFGGVLSASPVQVLAHRLSFAQAALVLFAMLPMLLLAAAAWRRFKTWAPHEAQAVLAFVSIAFVVEFLTRAW
jgi:hypothetical protein